MELAQRFVPQGGTSKCYFDRQRAEFISYRQFLKRCAIFPESRAAANKRNGCGKPRCPRKDKGIPRRSQRKIFRFILSNGKTVVVQPQMHNRYLFHIDSLIVCSAGVAYRPRHIWTCRDCSKTFSSQRAMAEHSYYAHYSDACKRVGQILPAILPTGHISTRARKARMGWRVDAPDYR